jgi:predicted ferric reductase
VHIGLLVPYLFAASLCTLLITNAPLPGTKISWVNRFFAAIRAFKINDAEYGAALTKKNQFGVGEANFNLMAIWLVFIPTFVQFFGYLPITLEYARDGAREEGQSVLKGSMESTSYYFGWVGVFALCFFLIPVTRHSILLVAMNWSPVHALRLHIWAGYIAFVCETMHGLILVVVWFMYTEGPIYREFIPPVSCWTGTFPEGSLCSHQIYNFTGIVAYIFYVVVWGSSLHWFRRKWYRMFYLLHVSFGTLTLLASVWHFEFIALYFLPSILYYLASTSPTLVQALASRFRGGVQIKKVIVLEDAGNCLEVHFSMDDYSRAMLNDNHPNKFVKLCVPKISIVWHPFTVYNHPCDPSTMRMLFRPIGPFTQKLQSALIAPERPVTLVDGFYRGGDHCQSAFLHDHVSIVAGGIAITPFISMMTAVLKSLSESSNQEAKSSLRSMTLVWICREAGLISFLKSSYLEDIAKSSKEIHDFQLKVKIYYTGTPCEGKLTGTFAEASEKTLGLVSDSSDQEKSSEASSGENADLAAAQENQRHTIYTEGEKIDNEVDTEQSSKGLIENKGHPMELARMFPGRYSLMIWNMPLFLVYSTTIWLGYHFLFFPYGFSETSLKMMSQETWVTVLVILFFFGVGLVIELTVLKFRHLWPAPQPDNFDLAVATATEKNEKLAENDEQEETHDVSSMFQLLEGRPSAEEILKDAQLASAPGVFMCGPGPLIQKVKVEARKENSVFGLTRYALYEDVFEM